jgi:T3SS (YopN, CesT) and YbjN peptide-binding chaperone 1/T3SS (YopN, CesT) and YbjN peptide-binding chaperone 3
MVRKSRKAVADTDQAASVAWPAFTQQLTGVLGALEEDQFLVITVKRTNRFVQFAAQGAFGMRAETTSNDYLAPSERLGTRQIAALATAGWRGQTAGSGESTPEKDPDGSPNFFVEFDHPVPDKDVAQLAVHTLAQVLRVPHPGFLEYEVFDIEGNPILLPSLGLKRAARRPQAPDAANLAERLLATLRETMGIADLEYDEDGDIGVRHGSIAAFVRLVGHPWYVRIHSRILSDIEEMPELLSRLNGINAQVRHLHFVAQNDGVYALADLPAEPFVSEHVASVFLYFCQIADGIDSLLQGEFGGQTAFAETVPSVLKH